jgi:hypothetical protein
MWQVNSCVLAASIRTPYTISGRALTLFVTVFRANMREVLNGVEYAIKMVKTISEAATVSAPWLQLYRIVSRVSDTAVNEALSLYRIWLDPWRAMTQIARANILAHKTTWPVTTSGLTELMELSLWSASPKETLTTSALSPASNLKFWKVNANSSSMSGKVTVRNLKVFGLAEKSCNMVLTKSNHMLISLVLTRDAIMLLQIKNFTC